MIARRLATLLSAPLLVAAIVLVAPSGARADDGARVQAPPPAQGSNLGLGALALDPAAIRRMIETVALFGLASLAPAAVLMTTAFVRVHMTLSFLRQALGNPQIPNNQVLGALALFLTILIMKPVATSVHETAIKPYLEHKIAEREAWGRAVKPIKGFMVDQIFAVHHQQYLVDLYKYAHPESSKSKPPANCEDLPLDVVLPAFLLSELATALVVGFAVSVPFLVIDFVVSSVLAAMGLFMLPPAQVALPVKLIVFVLAGGWWLVADMLLRSFAIGSAGAH